ncbi:MAG: sulfate/molybdate ABC transporter ATP-binding protein [Planctomycetes bacterium]|nr:sulfate/molybdate ABC transporter ATP-binding protein [Planctomycetota bacterium]
MSIEVHHLTKTFGTFAALRDVSLTVLSGELVAILGPSGSGKTTLLRIIAGLERPDEGSGPILFHEKDMARRNVGDRQVGFVFQHYALFRHMSVFENVAFGLRVRARFSRPSKQQIRLKVQQLLSLVQMEGMAERYPGQLSGGQRQRVALARALAVEPKVLLLDEPFGALDAKVRQELRRWLRRLHDEISITSVFVTHDQDEALELADRVVVMNQGAVEQIGTPDELFHHPKTEFVMSFLGQVNRFHGRVEGGKVLFASITVSTPRLEGAPAGHARVFIRPHELDLDLQENGRPGLKAFVLRIYSAGPTVRLELAAESGETFLAELSQDRFQALKISAGSTIFVAPRDLRVFGSGNGR